VKRSTTDTEGDLEMCSYDVVVDGIKCCGQVEQGEDRRNSVITAHRSTLSSAVSRSHTGRLGTVSRQKVCRRQVAVELPENNTRKKLGRHR